MINRFWSVAAGLGIFLSLSAGHTVLAQTAPVVPHPAEARQPSFTSGGLRMTVGSVATSNDGRAITVSLVLSNDSPTDVLASIIGQIEGVDDAGNSFQGRQVSSFAHCQYSQTRDNALKDCTKPDNVANSYTEIDKGNSVVIPVSMFSVSGQPSKGKKFSLSMTLGVVAQDSTTDSDALSPKSHQPMRMRLISIGVPLISINQGEG